MIIFWLYSGRMSGVWTVLWDALGVTTDGFLTCLSSSHLSNWSTKLKAAYEMHRPYLNIQNNLWFKIYSHIFYETKL